MNTSKIPGTAPYKAQPVSTATTYTTKSEIAQHRFRLHTPTASSNETPVNKYPQAPTRYVGFPRSNTFRAFRVVKPTLRNIQLRAESSVIARSQKLMLDFDIQTPACLTLTITRGGRSTRIDMGNHVTVAERQ
jgi:hypothetical protein